MRRIAITVPEFFEGEASAITTLLRGGDYWRVHVRKPNATDAQVEKLLKEIPHEFYPRLTMHYYFEIAVKYSLGGLHLSSRNSELPDAWSGLVSRSFHSIEEIGKCDYDYAFLSPIYPSISKPGYKGEFDFNQLRRAVDAKIFALGGVTHEKIAELKEIGFGGVAMLGNVWRPVIDSNKFQLQFITHATELATLITQVGNALEGGCRWIQLRHKGADAETLLREGREIRRLCDGYNATFIIDDHVELVEILGADGVHLGKNDMPVEQARNILGIRKIIGATANSFTDIEAAINNGADYVGLGPYRFTTTKEKLSPILGLDGYLNILKNCSKHSIGIPIVAIGGIEVQDIASIIESGVAGIAVSGAIRNAENQKLATQNILQILRETK